MTEVLFIFRGFVARVSNPSNRVYVPDFDSRVFDLYTSVTNVLRVVWETTTRSG